MPEMTLSMDEVLEMYDRGELNRVDVYTGGAQLVDETNIERFLRTFHEEALPTYLRQLTHPTLSLTAPEPSRAEIERVHSAVRGWLERHPQLQAHVAPEFMHGAE